MADQRDETWMKTASPEEIVRAVEAGELTSYLGGKTDDQLAYEARVRATPDRLYAEAYGFDSHSQLTTTINQYGSSALEVMRREMTPAQLEKLEWLETASASEAYAAEQAGELDNLLGRDAKTEASRIAAVSAQVRDAVTQAFRH